MSVLPRDLLQRAFPDNPRLRSSFEELDNYLSTAQDNITSLISSATDAITRISALEGEKNEPYSDLLFAIASIPPVAVGAIEIIGPNIVNARGIDAIDDASLVSRSNLISYVGLGASRPALSTQKRAVYFDTTLATNGQPVFWTGTNWVDSTGSSPGTPTAVAWGAITGTLSAQTDLQTALNGKASLTGGNTFTGNQTFSNDVTVNGTLTAGGTNNFIGPLSGAAADNNVYWSCTNANQFWTFWRWASGSPVTQAELQVNDGSWRFGSPQFNFTDVPGSTTYATLTSTGLTSTGAVTSTSTTAGIGYSGSGGSVSQTTSKSNGVTINRVCGRINMSSASLAAGAKVSFTVTNSAVAATDIVIANVLSGGTANAYRASVTATAAGSFTVTVENITAGALAEAPVIGFAIIKAV